MKLTMTYIRKKGIGAVRRGGIIASLASMVGVISSFLHLHFSFLIIPFSFIMLLSCSSSSDGGNEPEPIPHETTMLELYVYAPGQAIPTRGNLGEVDADEAENAINTLQIWVYTHNKCDASGVEDEDGDYKLVTYFKTNAFMASSNEGTTFELPIADWYANLESHPNVDVYVLANVTGNNCGLDFDESTSKATLEDAVLGADYFGLNTPVIGVPFEGLPMSGVLRNQSVYGSSPILRLGTSENMARVKLARAVSRIRFVFSCSNDFDGLKINSVKLDNGMIPDEEYLFLQEPENNSTFGNPYDYDDNDFNIKGTAYNVVNDEHPAPSLFSLAATAQCEDPAHYAWDRLVNDEKAKNSSITDQELADAYEELINEGLSSDVAPTYSSDVSPTLIDPGHDNPRLTERRVYLRESDKQLTGKIYYQVKGKNAANYSTVEEATFSMAAEGDFSRNHTWIVYAYLSWAKIEIVAVKVVDWTSATAEHELYNW